MWLSSEDGRKVLGRGRISLEVRAEVDRSDAIRHRCRGQPRSSLESPLSLHLNGKWEEIYKTKDETNIKISCHSEKQSTKISNPNKGGRKLGGRSTVVIVSIDGSWGWEGTGNKAKGNRSCILQFPNPSFQHCS